MISHDVPTTGLTEETGRMTTTLHPTERARREFAELQDQLLTHYGVDAESRFVELTEPVMRAHVLEAGRGQPVVVLHGGDGEAVDWAPMLGVLQHDLHLHAVDRPGFGLSDPFDYRHVDLRAHAGDFTTSLLDALGLERATLVGGSMGGFFALATALDHPDRVEKLVLVGMPLGLSRSAPLPLRIICGVPGLASLSVRSWNNLEGQHKQYRTMFHVDPDTVPELYFRTRLAGQSIPGSAATWARLLRRIGGLGGIRRQVYLGDAVSRLEPPALIIWGEHDMAPARDGEAAADRMPMGRFVHLDGVGHFPFLECPDVTADLILRFLAE